MGVNDIILLLEFCLKTPISPSKTSSLNRLRGVAMGSPVSPIVANFIHGVLRAKSSKYCPHLPGSGAGL